MKKVADVLKNLQQIVDEGNGDSLVIFEGGFTLDSVADLSPNKKVVFGTNDFLYRMMIKDRDPHKTFLDELT